MRKHTKEFKSSISTFGRELDSKITVIGTNLVLGKEDLYSVKPITNATLLKTVMKEVDFESKKQIGIGQEVNIKSGVKVNNEYEYIDYGNYSVYKNEYKAETDTYSHICYDKMLKTMINYVPLDIIYPINLREYITAIATKCGLEFADKNSTFANYNTAINEDHFSNGNYTFRDVLDYIAQLVGGWFCINDNDELEIRYPELARNYGEVSGENVSFISNVEDKINTIIVDGKSTQETSTQGKNIVPTDFSEWESGEYALTDGRKTAVNTRVRVKRLIEVKPTTTYYVKTSSYFYFALREYNASGTFTRSIGGLESIKGTTFTTSENGYYIGVSLYEGTSYADFAEKWADVKPFICLNSIPDKEYADFIPNKPSPDYPSEVECVKSKNLFDGVMESGGINHTTGNNQANSNLLRSKNYVSVKPNTTYIISNNGVGVAMDVLEYASDKSFISFAGTIAAGKPFTTSSTTHYIRFYRSNSNADKIQVEKGSVATDYVPYDTIQVKNIGKNLFDKDNANILNLYPSSTFLSNKLYQSICISIKPNTTYTLISLNHYSDSLTLGTSEEYPVAGGTVTNKTSVDKTKNNVTITSGANDKYLLAYIKWGTSISEEILDGIQLEKGPIATNYEPYTEEVINIDLQGNELCSIGNVKDELVIKDGRAKIIKIIGKRENNVVSNVTNTHTNIKYYQIAKPTDYERYNKYNYADDTLFTHASTKNTTITWNSEININKMVGGASSKFFWIGFPLETTLEQARELLSNNCLYYVLATPTEIDLGEVDTLATFDGINNVSLTTNLGTNMSITYTNDFEELDKHFLKDVNVSFMKKYGAINSVVFSRGGGSDNIYRKDNESINKNGLTEIKIADNPFLEGDDRENFIQPLFDKINGLEFYLMDVNSTGVMYLELGDLYYFNMIEDKPSLKSGLVKSGLRKAQGSSGGKFLCLLMNNEVKITQGLEESIYTDEPEITETDYKTASITDTSIKNAIIQTNKNSAEILLKVNSDEVVSAINLSPEKIKISSAKLDIDAIATFTNSKLAEAGSTVINGANITTGSINCDRLNGGTINGQAIRGGSISIQTGNYYFNMGTSTSNPNCSGLNVGGYGIKAYSNITATGFAITDSDTGKSQSINIYDGHGKVWYLTFKGGILTASEYK